jgi:hypothetical protein
VVEFLAGNGMDKDCDSDSAAREAELSCGGIMAFDRGRNILVDTADEALAYSESYLPRSKTLISCLLS